LTNFSCAACRAKALTTRLADAKDPFETTWPTVFAWFEENPDQTAKGLFQRLQAEQLGVFPDNQMRTLQRRVRQ
jgi:hypothetical protein